jgi:hypothetical protein
LLALLNSTKTNYQIVMSEDRSSRMRTKTKESGGGGGGGGVDGGGGEDADNKAATEN